MEIASASATVASGTIPTDWSDVSKVERLTVMPQEFMDRRRCSLDEHSFIGQALSEHQTRVQRLGMV